MLMFVPWRLARMVVNAEARCPQGIALQINHHACRRHGTNISM